MNQIGPYFTRTSRMHHKYHHDIYESFDIYRGQPQLFFTLKREKDPINQTQLAKKMNIASSTLTRMVQSLEKRGYVERHIDAHNQRQTLIALTPEGRDLHDQIKQKFDEADERIFGDFSKEEKEQFHDLLKKIQDRLRDELDGKETCQ